jgi:hypothetical protein
MTLETWMPDIGVSVGLPCDLFVLNGVGEVKLLLPTLKSTIPFTVILITMKLEEQPLRPLKHTILIWLLTSL